MSTNGTVRPFPGERKLLRLSSGAIPAHICGIPWGIGSALPACGVKAPAQALRSGRYRGGTNPTQDFPKHRKGTGPYGDAGGGAGSPHGERKGAHPLAGATLPVTGSQGRLKVAEKTGKERLPHRGRKVKPAQITAKLVNNTPNGERGDQPTPLPKKIPASPTVRQSPPTSRKKTAQDSQITRT